MFFFFWIQKGKDEPDAVRAAQIGIDSEGDERVMTEKYNCNIQDFVAKLPGVNTKNLRVILNKGHSLDHLVQLNLVGNLKQFFCFFFSLNFILFFFFNFPNFYTIKKY